MVLDAVGRGNLRRKAGSAEAKLCEPPVLPRSVRISLSTFTVHVSAELQATGLPRV